MNKTRLPLNPYVDPYDALAEYLHCTREQAKRWAYRAAFSRNYFFWV